MISWFGLKYLLLIGLILAPFITMAECRQNEGNTAIQNGDYSLAFSKLRDCDRLHELSGDTLMSLAGLYMMPEITHFNTEKGRVTKVFKFLKLASYKANEDALVTLSSFYISGEPLLLIKPNKKVRKCLLSLTEVKSEDLTKEVDGCISMSMVAGN